jgi:hypothetical protein
MTLVSWPSNIAAGRTLEPGFDPQGVLGRAPRSARDRVQERHQVGEEDVVGIRAGRIVEGVGRVAVDQREVAGGNPGLPGQLTGVSAPAPFHPRSAPDVVIPVPR